MTKIVYFARLDRINSPGIYNKLVQTVDAFRKNGLESELVLVEGEGGILKALPSVINLLIRLLTLKSDVVMVRNDILMAVYFPAILILRLRGVSVLIDIPTPVSNWIEEINLSKHKSFFWRLRRTLLIRLSFPWSLWPATKIIQYANESAYFSFGNTRNTILTGNGIDLDHIQPRMLSSNCSGKRIVLIGVAALAEWHGYDRVIRSMARYNSMCLTETSVNFFVVGDGPVKESLQQLASDLGVSDCVKFFGFVTGESLNQLYNESDIAVASLGLYRVGLNEASSLKSREYVARGLPFINSGRDFDFEPKPEFVFQVENNQHDLDLQEIVKWFKSLNYSLELRDNIRDFALKKLSFQSKINSLVNDLRLG